MGKSIPENTSDRASSNAIKHVSERHYDENFENAQAYDRFLDELEKEVMSDRVEIYSRDEHGIPIEAEPRIVSLSAYLDQTNEAMSESKQDTAEPAGAVSTVVATKNLSLFLKEVGLTFLTDPPSSPGRTVRIQLSGPVKFGTSVACHDVVVVDRLVILVTDTRVKKDILELSFEDHTIEMAMMVTDKEGQETTYNVYPPIPEALTYDIGVLRHFIFIRRNAEETTIS